jgi:hypothetical protein
MDPNKWKSVAVPIKVWEMLKTIAESNDRSVGGTISFLTKKEYEKNIDTNMTSRVA